MWHTKHRTPVLSGTCELQQPRAEAAWGLPCSLTLTLKNPRAAHVAQLPWHKLWAALCPRVPSCKKTLQSGYKLFKEFWELLLKSWVLSVRAERILQCKFPSVFSTGKQLALLPGETNSRGVKLDNTLTSKGLWMNFSMVGLHSTNVMGHNQEKELNRHQIVCSSSLVCLFAINQFSNVPVSSLVRLFAVAVPAWTECQMWGSPGSVSWGNRSCCCLHRAARWVL